MKLQEPQRTNGALDCFNGDPSFAVALEGKSVTRTQDGVTALSTLPAKIGQSLQMILCCGQWKRVKEGELTCFCALGGDWGQIGEKGQAEEVG